MIVVMTKPERVAAQRSGGEMAGGEVVRLAHGGGGEMMRRLIEDHIVPVLGNAKLSPLTDGAVLSWSGGDAVLTTDSFVVTPLEFPGGDIGRLAVAGTVNDLAVMGAEPIALSLGLILEEGLELVVLDRVLRSIATTAREAGVEVVTGDTKVIERRVDGAAGMFINTSGVGRMRAESRLSVTRIAAGDAILVNGQIAEHGLTIMSMRAGVGFETKLRSDAAPLNGLVAALLASGADIRFLRDATRGGVACVTADICEGAGLTVELDEAAIPISAAARHAAEMLGLDPLDVANEGVIVCVVAERDGKRALAAMRSHPLGRHAAIVGRISEERPALVVMKTRAGGRRIVQRPYGEELPRIC